MTPYFLSSLHLIHSQVLSITAPLCLGPDLLIFLQNNQLIVRSFQPLFSPSIPFPHQLSAGGFLAGKFLHCSKSLQYKIQAIIGQSSQCSSPDSVIYPPDHCVHAPDDPAVLRD